MNKKGDMFQVLFLIVILLVVSIVGLLFLTMTVKVNNFWDDSGMLNDTIVGTESIDTMQDIAPKTTDYAIFFLFIGLNIGVLAAAVKTNFSPVIIFAFLLLTLIAIMVAAGAVNMYQGLAQQDEILSTSDQLTLTNFIFSEYFPLVISVLCGAVMIIMWGKSGGEF